MNALIVDVKCESCGEDMSPFGGVLACTKKGCSSEGVKYDIPTIKLRKFVDRVEEEQEGDAEPEIVLSKLNKQSLVKLGEKLELELSMSMQKSELIKKIEEAQNG